MLNHNLTPEEHARLEEKREQFYVAAEPLFERYGYRKTTVEEVCRAAGASKRTFYELFNDKADLAQHLMLHVANMIRTHFLTHVQAEMSAFEKFDLILEEYVRLGREHRIFHILMQDMDLMATFGEHSKDIQFTQLIEILQAVIEEGIERGEFRPLDSEAATWMIFSLLDSMYYLLPEYMAQPGAFEDSSLASSVRDFIRHALVAQ